MKITCFILYGFYKGKSPKGIFIPQNPEYVQKQVVLVCECSASGNRSKYD